MSSEVTHHNHAEMTFTLMTYNLWKTDGVPTFWETRRGVLLRQLRQLDPDVLLVQELCPEIAACVLEALPGHNCIDASSRHKPDLGNDIDGRNQKDGHDTGLFEGWLQEGNIFYRSSRFSLVQWGAEHIEQEEPLRRLFWARLQPRALASPHTLLLSTAHFTWQGHPRECSSDLNLRKRQARLAAAALDRLQSPCDLACFLGGDLNESFWPKRIMEVAGFCDCFSALGLPCRPTHPCRPTLAAEDQHADQALDWLFARGGLGPTSGLAESDDSCSTGGGSSGGSGYSACSVRALAASVVRDSAGLSSSDPQERRVLAVQPSDHAPVLAVYRVQVQA